MLHREERLCHRCKYKQPCPGEHLPWPSLEGYSTLLASHHSQPPCRSPRLGSQLSQGWFHFFNLAGSLHIYQGLQFCVFLRSLCVQKCLCLNVFPVLSLRWFSFCLLVLCYSDLFVSVLSCYYCLGACLFSKQRQKRVRTQMGGDVGRNSEHTVWGEIYLPFWGVFGWFVWLVGWLWFSKQGFSMWP